MFGRNPDRLSRRELEAAYAGARTALDRITASADTRVAAAREQVAAAEMMRERLGDVARSWQARALQLETWQANHVCTPPPALEMQRTEPAADDRDLREFHRIADQVGDDLPSLFVEAAGAVGAPTADDDLPAGPTTKSWSLAASRAIVDAGRRVDDQAVITIDSASPADVDEQTVAIPAGGGR